MSSNLFELFENEWHGSASDELSRSGEVACSSTATFQSNEAISASLSDQSKSIILNNADCSTPSQTCRSNYVLQKVANTGQARRFQRRLKRDDRPIRQIIHSTSSHTESSSQPANCKRVKTSPIRESTAIDGVEEDSGYGSSQANFGEDHNSRDGDDSTLGVFVDFNFKLASTLADAEYSSVISYCSDYGSGAPLRGFENDKSERFALQIVGVGEALRVADCVVTARQLQATLSSPALPDAGTSDHSYPTVKAISSLKAVNSLCNSTAQPLHPASELQTKRRRESRRKNISILSESEKRMISRLLYCCCGQLSAVDLCDLASTKQLVDGVRSACHRLQLQLDRLRRQTAQLLDEQKQLVLRVAELRRQRRWHPYHIGYLPGHLRVEVLRPFVDSVKLPMLTPAQAAVRSSFAHRLKSRMRSDPDQIALRKMPTLKPNAIVGSLTNGSQLRAYKLSGGSNQLRPISLQTPPISTLSQHAVDPGSPYST